MELLVIIARGKFLKPPSSTFLTLHMYQFGHDPKVNFSRKQNKHISTVKEWRGCWEYQPRDEIRRQTVLHSFHLRKFWNKTRTSTATRPAHLSREAQPQGTLSQAASLILIHGAASWADLPFPVKYTSIGTVTLSAPSRHLLFGANCWSLGWMNPAEHTTLTPAQWKWTMDNQRARKEARAATLFSSNIILNPLS